MTATENSKKSAASHSPEVGETKRAAGRSVGKGAKKAQKRERQRANAGTSTATPPAGVTAEAAAGSASSDWETSDWLIAAAVVAIAFGIRLAYVLQLQDSPLFEHPIVDARYHDQWAADIAAGKQFITGPFFRAPLYAYLLGAIYAVTDHSYVAPRIVQSVLGASSCGLLFALGRQLFDRRIATAAATAAATYWILIYFDGELLVPTLIIFLDLLMIVLLVRAARRPSVLAFLLAGAALGVSAIGRANVLLFAPAIVGWVYWMYRSEPLRAVRYIAGVTIGCLLIVLPVTARNYVVGDDVVLTASSGGVNFYIGNNPKSDGMTAIVPGTPGDFWGGHRASIAIAEKARGRSLRPSEVSSYYYEQGRAFIFSQPAAALDLTLRKLRYFFSRWEIPNNKYISFWTERFVPFTAFLPLGFGVVGPLGLLGIATCRRRALELFPLWGFVLVYTISVVMFFSTARFRAPVLAPLILLACYALFHVYDQLRERGPGAAVVPLLVLVPALLFVNLGDRPGEANIQAISHESLAQAYGAQGVMDLAEDHHRHALQYDPQFLTARYNLATILSKQERYEESIIELRRAIETPHRERRGESIGIVAISHNQLGVGLNNTDRHEEAVVHFRRSIELQPDPTHTRTYRNLASTLTTLGRNKEAVEALEHVLEVDPSLADERTRIAGLLIELGRPSDAVPHYEALLRANPSDHAMRMALSDTLASAGRFADSLAVLESAEAGSDPNLLNNLAWKLATGPSATLRDGAKAIRIASRACPDVSNCHPAILDTLAAGYAETGEFDRALELARAALDAVLASKEDGADENAQVIRSHIASYEAGRPFRESANAEH